MFSVSDVLFLTVLKMSLLFIMHACSWNTNVCTIEILRNRKREGGQYLKISKIYINLRILIYNTLKKIEKIFFFKSLCILITYGY